MKGKTKITFYGNCLLVHLTSRLKSYQRNKTYLALLHKLLALLHDFFSFAAQRI
jgi:hypothetical protein